jgi:hypothetical protein
MRKEQFNYAENRLRRKYAQKEAAIVDKHTTKEIRLTIYQRRLALKKGKFKVVNVTSEKGKYRPYEESNINTYIKFDGEQEHSKDLAAMQKELKELEHQFTKVLDQLYLGDAEKALKLIESF